MRFDGKTNPQRAVKLTLTKLSNVGAPAHGPALARIIKTQDEKEVFKLLFNDALDDIQMRQDLRDILNQFGTLEDAIRDSIMETLNDDMVPDKKAAIFTSLMQFMAALQELIDSDLFEGTETVIAMQKQGDEDEDEEMRREGRRRGSRRSRTRKYMRKTALDMIFKSISGEFKAGMPLIKNQEITNDTINKAVADWDKDHKDFVNEYFKTSNQEDETVSKELEAKVAKMEADLRKNTILANMSDGQKATLNKMSEEGQGAFFKEDDISARNAILTAKEKEIETAKGQDETFTMGGETIAKSEVGAAVFTMLKAQSIQLQATEENLKKEKEMRMDKEYQERAGKLWPNLKGTDVEKGQMLKEIEALPTETKKSRMEMMDSANESAANVFSETGHGYTETLKGEEKMEALAKTIQTSKPELTYEQAYTEAMKSAEGGRIYKEMDASRPN